MDKKQTIKSVLWFFTAFGTTAAVLRLWNGLGATTALSDMDPWGFWIGFDVMAGVALAAGGFTLAAMYYIFHIRALGPATRPAIVTAFLGYVIVALGLVFDLGIPWNIWHPMIFWQHHSVLFEVGTCVMLYLTVLSLEVAPIVLEHPVFNHPLFHRMYNTLKTFTIPIVILGIMLSTLHQSSLGSLFLIMPFRVEPLWYSPILYINYFISAVSLGCAMVIAESTVTGYIYGHKPNPDLFRILGKICSVVLGVYFVIRIGDLSVRGILPQAFKGTWKTNLFLIEIFLSTLLPAVLFNLPKIRKSAAGMFWTALLVIVGFVLNRQAILLTMERKGAPLYFPSIGELGITFALISGAALVFFFFVENFNLFSHGGKQTPGEDTGSKKGFFLFWDLKALEKSFILFSAAAIAGVGIAFAFLPSSAIHGFSLPETPVRDAVGWDTLTIDGNRRHESVRFPHHAHADRMGHDKKACMKCHHMSRPGDGPSSCNECHRDMFLQKSIFDHRYHQAALGGNLSCDSCHGSTKAREFVASCNMAACHPSLLHSDTSSYMAISYLDAMHSQCRDCHEAEAAKADSIRQRLEQAKLNFPDSSIAEINADSIKALGYCSACHPGMPADADVIVSRP